jgi:hypothetical protein
MEEINVSSLGKRRRDLEIEHLHSPMKRCKLLNFDAGESLTAIGRMMSDNPRLNFFELKCGAFEFTAKSI